MVIKMQGFAPKLSLASNSCFLMASKVLKKSYINLSMD